MTKREIYKLGVDAGQTVAIEGTFSDDTLASEEKFVEACDKLIEQLRLSENNPLLPYLQEKNADALVDAFEHGTVVGIRKVWRSLNRRVSGGGVM